MRFTLLRSLLGDFGSKILSGGVNSSGEHRSFGMPVPARGPPQMSVEQLDKKALEHWEVNIVIFDYGNEGRPNVAFL